VICTHLISALCGHSEATMRTCERALIQALWDHTYHLWIFRNNEDHKMATALLLNTNIKHSTPVSHNNITISMCVITFTIHYNKVISKLPKASCSFCLLTSTVRCLDQLTSTLTVHQRTTSLYEAHKLNISPPL
jgi:hypothetical protein